MELMSAVLERGNMMRAYERVLRNKGAPGVDGMTLSEGSLARDQGAIAGRSILSFGGA